MNILKPLLAIGVIQFACISNAQVSENCHSGYKLGSAEQSACNARNQDRYQQERRYKEDQAAKKIAEENQKRKDLIDTSRAARIEENIALEKKQQKEEQEKKEFYRNLEEKQREKQSSNELTEEQNLKLLEFTELLKDTTVFVAIASEPWAKRATELSKTGKCKESRNLMKDGAKNSDKRTRAVSEYMQGSVAESCDKNDKLALDLFILSAKNGSYMGKEKLKEYFER